MAEEAAEDGAVKLESLEDTDPPTLEEIEDAQAPEPPDEWDADAHDDEDVLQGVEITEDDGEDS